MDSGQKPQTSFRLHDIYQVELITAGLVAVVYVHTHAKCIQCNLTFSTILSGKSILTNLLWSMNWKLELIIALQISLPLLKDLSVHWKTKKLPFGTKNVFMT